MSNIFGARLPASVTTLGRSHRRVAFVTLLLALTWSVSGCGGTSVSPALAVIPSSATLVAGKSQQFTAIESGGGAAAGFSYKVLSRTDGLTAGTITTGGLYTAPSSIVGPNSNGKNFQDTVQVQANDGSARSEKILVNVTFGLAVSPSAASVSVNRTQPFAATVAGDPQNRVTWSLASGSPGRIDSGSGVYTAPTTAAIGTTATVVATAIDGATTTQASVTLQSASSAFNIQ